MNEQEMTAEERVEDALVAAAEPTDYLKDIRWVYAGMDPGDDVRRRQFAMMEPEKFFALRERAERSYTERLAALKEVEGFRGRSMVEESGPDGGTGRVAGLMDEEWLKVEGKP
jgi:hypothetical protein